MRKRFSVRWTYINVRGPVNMMEQPVGNRFKFDHFVRNSQLSDQRRRKIWIIRAGIGSRRQLACQEQNYLARTEPPLDQRHSSKQRLEVAIVVVMTHEQQTECVRFRTELFLNR